MDKNADPASIDRNSLVGEIQHRVKNSIAMISSFVALEEGRTEDPGFRAVLENLRFRVDAVSSMYRLLGPLDPVTLDLRAYLEKIVMDLVAAFDQPGVGVDLALQDLSFDAKRSGPLGILCTELVVNAYRHGFRGGRQGRLAVALGVEGDRLLFSVADDGHGLPADFSLGGGPGMGLQLAKMLAQQLRGKFAVQIPEGGGARFVLDMPFALPE